jgi:two-component system response regulator AtoC
VGELSAPLQAKLLTFLDGGRFRRLAGASELTSTARVVAATNRDLEARVRTGEFREDLWFRLSVFRLSVPPLRERREDLPALAHGLLARIAADQGRRDVPTLTQQALDRLAAYRFPGNVRELANILERASVFEGADALALAWLSTSPTGSAETAGFMVTEVQPLDEVERRYARWALAQLGGRKMDTAKALGVSHPTFAKLVKEEPNEG